MQPGRVYGRTMRVVLVLALVSCGRIGYDGLASTDAPVDDRLVEPPCPDGTSAVTEGAATCIELVERGTVPWTTAKQDCEALGRRLCTDAEWAAGCENVVGIVDMIDGGWEWVAEEAGGVAQKRGSDACTAVSSHAVIDPYEYRCCVDR